LFSPEFGPTLARDVASKRDYYEILGVSSSASDDEIKRAYRRLAVELHPDKNPGDQAAEERFKEASQAYSVLCDAEKRKRYDRMGHGAFTGADGGGQGFDPMDFDAFSEMIGGLFGEMFRKKGKRARDLKYELTIRFEEAALGCEKTIEVTRNVTCDGCKGSGSAPGYTPTVCVTCRGRGEVRYQKGLLPASRPCGACQGSGKQITHPCVSCKGEGVAPRREQLNVTIPAGVEDGSVRSVRGGGEQTTNGQGDLHVYVHVEPHPLFTRDGADILCTVPVSYSQAVLGDQLEVPTLEGIVRMRLPPGTESAKVFRLRGKGMPVFGGVGKGDQLVKVVVEIPQEVSKRQRELLEELAREMGESTTSERRRFLDKLRALFE
jgi:molecular chaperone DnaJ